MDLYTKHKVQKEIKRNVGYIEKCDMTENEIRKEIQGKETAIQEAKRNRMMDLVMEFSAEKRALEEKLESLK